MIMEKYLQLFRLLSQTISMIFHNMNTTVTLAQRKLDLPNVNFPINFNHNWWELPWLPLGDDRSQSHYATKNQHSNKIYESFLFRAVGKTIDDHKKQKLFNLACVYGLCSDHMIKVIFRLWNKNQILKYGMESSQSRNEILVATVDTELMQPLILWECVTYFLFQY